MNTPCLNTSNLRSDVDFNFDWQFTLEGESAPDSDWREVRLPHDWSVEGQTTQEHGGNATAYLPGGVGHYRKSFVLPASAQGKRFRIEFDGVYSKSDVWVNGQHLGHRPYGYIPFAYDLTEHLTFGADAPNQIVVRVDRTAYIDCRWYSGSGIYRHVRLIATDPVSVPQHGVFVTTPSVTDAQARVCVETQVQNTTDNEAKITLTQTVLGPDGEAVGATEQTLTVPANTTRPEQQFILVANPKRWDIDDPQLYSVKTTLSRDGEKIDEVVNRLGIRTFHYDAKKGFFLNGRSVKFKGVCLHHDGGAVGAAVPLNVWRRRLEKLQDAGVNAIRTAHNPPSAEFLDLCDKMGFLVQDEAFDEWHHAKDKRKNYKQEAEEDETRGYSESFAEWSDRDVAAMVLRDRNHPSIVMWSIGNEIEWTYPAQQYAAGYWEEGRALDPNGKEVNYYWDVPPHPPEEILRRYQTQDLGPHNIATVAKRLADGIRAVDRTRPVTANTVIPSLGMVAGYGDALDIVGTSYRQILTDYLHENYPDVPFFGSENWTQWHEWEWCIDRDYAPGIFLWTGIRYMGESGGWPNRGGNSGLIDFAGLDMPAWHHFKCFWNLEEAHLHLEVVPQDTADFELDGLGHQSDHANPYELVDGVVRRLDRDDKQKMKWSWHGSTPHWNQEVGQPVVVEAFTNCVSVELFLNGESLGVRELEDVAPGNDKYLLLWHVPAWKAGKLEARGTTADGQTITRALETAGDAAALHLEVDYAELPADRYAAAHVTLQLRDAEGRPALHKDHEVTFQIDGPLRLLGIDNGSIACQDRYNVPTVETYKGRCVLLVQALDEAGEATITATTADGLTSNAVTVTLKPA
ncbi:glycoside hydrolase family 2 TIM barrel-domain containing protein [Algisphaera agarilytica]|uniref:Beta-galactosidase n=1 Tax=Algisphaera agarilytica TaxID=1385975 RepID=A0A7X0H5X6_9BACT|nr:glycoside hydrolase family 2 TIM barrel-domain containing protein [Algisphaera agarilytica]MBB6428706.1 hypothetical protein [Algisphaera agarilytica]